MIGKKMGSIAPLTLTMPDSVGLGVMFILGSLLCRYGAEPGEKAPEEPQA